jgi:hypothetical protein
MIYIRLLSSNLIFSVLIWKFSISSNLGGRISMDIGMVKFFKDNHRVDE